MVARIRYAVHGLTASRVDGHLRVERRQVVWVDSFRLVGAARQFEFVRALDAVFLTKVKRPGVDPPEDAAHCIPRTVSTLPAFPAAKLFALLPTLT